MKLILLEISAITLSLSNLWKWAICLSFKDHHTFMFAYFYLFVFLSSILEEQLTIISLLTIFQTLGLEEVTKSYQFYQNLDVKTVQGLVRPVWNFLVKRKWKETSIVCSPALNSFPELDVQFRKGKFTALHTTLMPNTGQKSQARSLCCCIFMNANQAPLL